MNSLPGTIAPDGVLCRVSDLRRALPPCISRPDLKIKIPLIPPARSNDRHTAFVRGIFSALTRRDHADLRSRAGLSIKRVWGGESLNCARLSTNRRTAYCSCARRCENAKIGITPETRSDAEKHHTVSSERCDHTAERFGRGTERLGSRRLEDLARTVSPCDPDGMHERISPGLHVNVAVTDERTFTGRHPELRDRRARARADRASSGYPRPDRERCRTRRGRCRR